MGVAPRTLEPEIRQPNAAHRHTAELASASRSRGSEGGLTSNDKSRVSVSGAPLPSDILARAKGLGSDIVVMPRRWADDGRAVYGESTLLLVKELRAEGLSAAFLDSGEDRVFEVKKSALLTGLAAIGIGIGGGVGTNATWAALKRLLHRHASDGDDSRKVEVTFVDLSEDGDGTQYTVRGPVRDVVDTVELLRSRSPSDELDRSDDGAVAPTVDPTDREGTDEPPAAT